MIHFTGDCHFGHRNVIKYCNRPWFNIHDMEHALVANFNEVLTDDDVLIWLGDCFFTGTEKAKSILSRIKGTHFYVRGNHDPGPEKMKNIGFNDSMFGDVGPYKVIFEGYETILSHYPYAEPDAEVDQRFLERRPVWGGEDLLLHGHVHTAWKHRDNMINCGVDVWGYKPVSLQQILDYAKENLIIADK